MKEKEKKMACSAFNPELPHRTPEEQAVWVARWNSKLLNSSCLQRNCSAVCLPGQSPLSAGCLACLERVNCQGTWRCLHNLGANPATLEQFQPLYAQTVPTLAPATLVGILLGALFGFLFLLALVHFVLYKTGRLPEHWRLWVEARYVTTTEEHQVPTPFST